MQRTAGNAAVSRLVAQRYTPPVKPPPAQAPGMRRVNADIGAKKQKLAAHPAPTAESRAAQDAAVAPPDDRQAQAKTQQAEKMNAAEPGDFDKAAFIAAVNQAVEAQAPKNLDEADKFSDSGNADRIKDEVDGQVSDGKDTSSEEIATATAEAPDTSNTTEKEVTPLTADQPPGNPGAPNAGDAVPARQPEEVTDFSEGQRDTEQRMAEADVTEEQLARGNEPAFDNALAEKKQGEEETAAAPAQARAAENTELQTAKSGAAAAGAQAMAGLTATREATGRQVDSGKTETKTADEQKREQVTATLQKVFDRTKTDVEKILDSLDGKVDTQFTNGEKRAREAFTADHERRMKAYKDKRYSGLRGKARWVKDKFAGLPEEANGIYQESRKLYVNQMQGVISDIADTIGRELGRAKTRIGQGRSELQAEVEKLPADLRRFGEEAAQDFAGQFDDLESQVDEKSEQLVQDLAQKYTEALDAIDEEITALQEANKGLWDRVKDAVVGVIQTIIELTNALMGILAKAASAVSKIIKDPIGFLGNVVRYVGDGLNLFTANIEQHLKTGLVSWLLGTAVKTGLQIPAKFDAKGIVQLLASLLGLTWDTIRAKIVRKGVPDKAMVTVEKSIPEAQALQREGPAGLTKEITGESGDLKKTILDDLKSYLIPTVIVAGIAWVVSLLTPASAFVRAVKGIIDIVTFIVTQAAQITDFMNAILDAVIAIADGAASGVPKLIESALSTSIPLLLGFLAALLGIGGLATKVRSVFQKVSRPVGRAIDKIIDRISTAAKKVWRNKKNQKRIGVDARERGDGGGDAMTPRHLAVAAEETTSSISGGVLEELNEVGGERVIHENGGRNASSTTRKILSENKNAKFDKNTRTLTLPSVSGLSNVNSLGELGGDISRQTGAPRIILKKGQAYSEIWASVNPRVRVARIPNGMSDPDAILRIAITQLGIVGFLEKIIDGSPIEVEQGGIKGKIGLKEFEEAWGRSQANVDWVKDRFRDAMSGHHEWIPSNYILEVTKRAYQAAAEGPGWIKFQHELRSETFRVVFKPTKSAKVKRLSYNGSRRGYTIPQGHSGAVYFKGKQQTKGQKAFHDELRGAFLRESTVKATAQAAWKVADEWIWRGEDMSPELYPDCYNRRDGGDVITAVDQAENFTKIEEHFKPFL
ncbi:hypothetical protein ACE11A_15910 [Streptomyces carpaticus]|uniref:Uncharacterized protein n=1 Tax=Streptomyces carpaticus TaxID=285558 RepID=A0ABV4ZNY8_9ACTN